VTAGAGRPVRWTPVHCNSGVKDAPGPPTTVLSTTPHIGCLGKFVDLSAKVFDLRLQPFDLFLLR
jgi:hypothetical protein